ncbi:hypothetical protein [Kistimonas asteriae]|uniref:hypothetical protein n=1 Tax=Kistimonas asteriae TaxID=517724 RepID=UPI001BA528F6|nr:hypothetical protein [Kistimonas asteriae]
MATEDESLHNAIYENNKLVNNVEDQLKQLDAMRQELGLEQGAGKAFMEQIPESAEKRNEAEKELQQLGSTAPSTSKKNRKKQKKRSKMARAMKNKLQI